ncbi:MAG TPA: hybrid sensor histidine kinase/response regulator [Casimicrobiaceae bacterium]|nr:hybrid sensor histidine kinase/response regulator [Casimicrobiaceae bacterium]
MKVTGVVTRSNDTMSPLATIPPALIARARADQVATLYAHGHRTTVSMGLGALILCAVMWTEIAAASMLAWAALISVNQLWRAVLVRAFERAQPTLSDAARWGHYWAIGSALAGSLWGAAAVAIFPESPAYQSLLIVCIFGAALGGLNLTAVYKPSFYGFVLPALVPLIVRVASVGDQVHWFIAGVMSVVLAFVVGFGHRLNDVLTRSLVIRYENVDLIAELKDRTRSAVDARAAAEAANLAKSQLLAAASHDLRQPLHALGLYVAALAARAQDAEWRPLVMNVESAANALEIQFAQLIDLSRLDAGALAPERSDVALGPLFARIRTEFAPQAAARGLSLRIVQTKLVVDSDPALLERIVGNLVANGIRYTNYGGVLIGARPRGEHVAIDVVDTGVGIATPDRQRIFEEFYRVRDDNMPSQARRGMGLGLAIVRRFADLLGHGIELDSREGIGSRFRVLVPRAARGRSRIRYRVSSSRGSDVCTTPSCIGRVVAVVDDDAATLDAMQTLFATWGANVVCGDTIDTLIEAIGGLERYPDLIVADLRLASGRSGIEAVRQLRHELGVPVPAIIVSGDTGTNAEREARTAGLMLLPKPVVAATLHATAIRLMQQSPVALAAG